MRNSDIMPSWLQGLFAVLPTPMVPGGALDLNSLDRLVDYYMTRGANGLVPVSIAGEGAFLNDEERAEVIERVAIRCHGRVPVIAGILEGDIEKALVQSRRAVQCGAVGLLVKPPRGNVPILIEHFATIARCVQVPIVLLDYPKAGPPLPVRLIQRMVETIPQICAIKLEEEPTPVKMARLRKVLKDRIRIFGGLGAAYCLEELKHGADGLFTGFPFPDYLTTILQCFKGGDIPGATAAFEDVLPMIIHEYRFQDGIVGTRKAMLQQLNVIQHAAVRIPKDGIRDRRDPQGR